MLDSLRLTGQIAPAEYAHTNVQTIYEHRVAPFAALETPVVASYLEYEDKTNLKIVTDAHGAAAVCTVL
jgi:hypothetical protein